MTRRFALVLLYMITAAAVVFAAATTDALMAELDSAISRREEYSAEREIRIDSLRHLASDTLPPTPPTAGVWSEFSRSSSIPIIRSAPIRRTVSRFAWKRWDVSSATATL